VGFGRRTGDLDETVKSRNIRALVLINPVGFFYDEGQPRGVMYEALEEFQKFANQKLKTGQLQVKVTFLPTRADQIEAALTQGLGDLIAYGTVVTPEREKRVAFSTPIQTDVTQIIVTGPKFGAVSTLADLGAKEVYVKPLTIYYTNLQKVNEELQKAGKKPIVIKAADKNLIDDDLVQMVNAGLIPATATTKNRAALWSQVLDQIQPQPDLVIASGVQLAWAVRKDNPQLKQLVDEFVSSHAVGTSFHPASPLFAKHQVGQEFDLGRRDEEVSDQPAAFPEVRGRVQLRLPDDRGPGLSGISAGPEQEEPQRRSGHHSGHSQECGSPSHQHSERRDG
jgi:membrane-bound lytic murein transglycosylase MltF